MIEFDESTPKWIDANELRSQIYEARRHATESRWDGRPSINAYDAVLRWIDWADNKLDLLLMSPEDAQAYLDAHPEFAEHKHRYEVELRERLGL